MDDWQLLNEYATRNSEEAFRTLVDRYAGMVYHTALRQLGNPHAAQEVTQAVFIALAQKAGRIPRQTILCGWLFRAARFAILNLRRDEACRRRHEQEAITMETNIQPDDSNSVWEQVSPLLNDALDALSKTDREIVMIRFFGNKSHKEVALSLGVTEDTAKKRLSRAVEKLRAIFARRGVVVTSVALATTLAAHGAQAAPAGLASSTTAVALAKGTAGAASTLAMAKGLLRLMAWAKAKLAIVVGAGLLIAAGTTNLIMNAVGPQPDDVIAQLERQSGKRVVWDKHLVIPADLNLKNLTLEKALDQTAIRAGGYWTVDYAVYGSEAGLQRLLDVLQSGDALQSGGWTNLSSRPLVPEIQLETSSPGGRGRNLMRMVGGEPGASRVQMVVKLSPEASARLGEEFAARMQAGDSGENTPPPEDGPMQVIPRAMDEGRNEGVLAPERLLAQNETVANLALSVPLPATAEAAARLAKQAHAQWATIYTLRKSPCSGAGIKLVHFGMQTNFFPTNMPFGQGIGGMSSNRFNLTLEDREAHDRAVQAYKQQH